MNEINRIESQLGKVSDEMANAAHDLAEGKIGAAEVQIVAAQGEIQEIASESARESKIKVNGRTKTIEGREVSHEEAVKLAFPEGQIKPNTKFTVTYRNAAQVPTMGELDAGTKVKVKPGRHEDDETIFNVTPTVLS
jgi:sRNA-binding protein